MTNIERSLSLYFVKSLSSSLVLVDEPFDSKISVDDITKVLFSDEKDVFIKPSNSYYCSFTNDSYKIFCNKLDTIQNIRSSVDNYGEFPRVIYHYEMNRIEEVLLSILNCKDFQKQRNAI